jgi:hypothetical protein
MKAKILTELETIAACHTRSLARFGDGELRLAVGGSCSSQRADKRLATELRTLLGVPSKTLVGIPNFAKTPNRTTWDRYAAHPYATLFKLPLYGSAFISRPDNAPWIDTSEYWDAVRGLWAHKDVVLVCGDEKSLRAVELNHEAASVTVVRGPRQHAYADINEIEAEIGKPAGPVLLCLGATATALAARLDRKGVHALDVGHLGMFMRHAGAYAFKPEQLASPMHRDAMAKIPWQKPPPDRLQPMAQAAFAYGSWEIEAGSVLDYGCGSGWFAEWMKAVCDLRVFEYDIVPGRDAMPKPADLVVGFDVMNWVEPAKRANVLGHICTLAKKGVYLEHLDPSGEIMADIQAKVRALKTWRARCSMSDSGDTRVWLTR